MVPIYWHILHVFFQGFGYSRVLFKHVISQNWATWEAGCHSLLTKAHRRMSMLTVILWGYCSEYYTQYTVFFFKRLGRNFISNHNKKNCCVSLENWLFLILWWPQAAENKLFLSIITRKFWWNVGPTSIKSTWHQETHFVYYPHSGLDRS